MKEKLIGTIRNFTHHLLFILSCFCFFYNVVNATPDLHVDLVHSHTPNVFCFTLSLVWVALRWSSVTDAGACPLCLWCVSPLVGCLGLTVVIWHGLTEPAGPVWNAMEMDCGWRKPWNVVCMLAPFWSCRMRGAVWVSRQHGPPPLSNKCQ